MDITSTDTLHALEWDRICRTAASLAASALGAERFEELRPFKTVELSLKTMDRTTEMVRLQTESSGGVPMDGLYDIRDELKRVSVEGASLEPEILLQIAATMDCSSNMKDYLRHRREKVPLLFELSDRLADLRDIARKIQKAIEPDGTVADDASAALSKIRREIRKENKALESKVQGVLEKWSAQGVLRDSVVNYREGKFVLPVKDEARRRVQGVIVDQSASGATVFMEPVETLEISNKLRQLEMDERREIHKILLELTALVHERLDLLWLSLETLADLDEIYARGRLAIRWTCIAPELTENGAMLLQNGRHPLLIERLREKVVPLSLQIEPPVRTIVISGPNAGGKTVALKTVGVLCMMAAAGLLIPAAPGSRLPFITAIYADIGDAQSIESDLSTFTAHIGRLSKMVREESEQKLVLIDEIGSSTDPAIGAALAQAVLKELTEQGAITLVTTHHGALKAFAHETDGIENGSMAFNEASLEPTYVFRPGLPGSSYALEIAKRVGFPENLLDTARGYLGKGNLGLEELVGELSRKIEEYEKLRKESDLKLTRYEALSKLYDERSKELKKIQAKARREALAESEQLIEESRKEIEAVIKEIREKEAGKQVIQSAKTRMEEVSKRLTTAKRKAEVELAEPKPELVPLKEIKVGVRAAVAELDSVGTIVAIQKNGKRVEVEMGGMRLWVDSKKLLEPEPEKKRDRNVNINVNLDVPYVSAELDLRGKYGDEALPMIDSYLTAAAERNLTEVKLIHGKGTGALRVKVREYLDTHPLVKSYHDGGANMDDFGSTCVVLY
ncbi:endonuclease MutS2 [bacterium]|nr:endonuclease MutS2 [bacterium]